MLPHVGCIAPLLDELLEVELLEDELLDDELVEELELLELEVLPELDELEELLDELLDELEETPGSVPVQALKSALSAISGAATGEQLRNGFILTTFMGGAGRPKNHLNDKRSVI